MDQELPQLKPQTHHSPVGIVFTFILGGIIGAAIMYYLTPRLYAPEINEKMTQTSPPPQQEPTTSSWIRTDILGPFSIEYPAGWHVALVWPDTPEKASQGIQLAIDPRPINLAPRGGPLTKITISDFSGIQNPEERYAQWKTNQKQSLETIEKENESKTTIGSMYHTKGKSTIYADLRQMEDYVLLIPSSNSTDKMNYHILHGQVFDDPSVSDILQHIMLSIQRAY